MKKAKQLIIKTMNLLFPTYGVYIVVIISNKVKRIFKKVPEHKFLFILSPPYCGSTMLNKLLATSSSVSANNYRYTSEGQLLPTVRKIMYDHNRRHEPDLDFDWEFIKKEWLKYWDTTKPILSEKSPPNIIRAHSISKVFIPSYFIIFYRNPYAQSESFMRRNKNSAREAAELAVRFLKYQKKNINTLENKLIISYEQLTEQAEDFVQKISQFIPELNDINTNQKFKAHNFKNKKLNIQNLNSEKLKMISPADLQTMNEVFSNEKELFAFFDYEIMK